MTTSKNSTKQKMHWKFIAESNFAVVSMKYEADVFKKQEESRAD